MCLSLTWSTIYDHFWLAGFYSSTSCFSITAFSFQLRTPGDSIFFFPPPNCLPLYLSRLCVALSPVYFSPPRPCCACSHKLPLLLSHPSASPLPDVALAHCFSSPLLCCLPPIPSSHPLLLLPPLYSSLIVCSPVCFSLFAPCCCHPLLLFPTCVGGDL